MAIQTNLECERNGCSGHMKIVAQVCINGERRDLYTMECDSCTSQTLGTVGGTLISELSDGKEALAIL